MMKKYFIAAVLWLVACVAANALFFASPPPLPAKIAASWSPVDLTSAYSASASTVSLTSKTVPTGALILVCVSESATGTSGGVTDGASNTYHLAQLELMNNSATIGFTAVYYAFNVTALSSASITFTKQSTVHQAGISAFYSTFGQTTSAVFDSATVAGNFGSSSAPTVTSAASAGQSGELFAACSGNRATSTFTQDTGNGWSTPFDSAGAAVPTSVLFGGGNFINSGTGTKTYAPTMGSSSSWADIITSFKHQ